MEKLIFSTITLNEMREVVRDAVRSEMNKSGNNESEGLVKNRLINRKKARELLGITDVTIINYEKAGLIRSYRMGGKIFYNLEEIENYIFNSNNRAEAVSR